MAERSIYDIATHLRRNTRNEDIIDLCDYVLASGTTAPKEIVAEAGCPVCAARRKVKAVAQKKWRGKEPA